MKEIRQILQHARENPDQSFVLGTLVKVQGSSYRRAGARVLLNARGRLHGSISGGCLENDLTEQAHGVLADGRARIASYDTTSENDLIWGAGSGCHGLVDILLEPLPGRDALFSFLEDGFRLRESAVAVSVLEGSARHPPGTWLLLASSGRLAARAGTDFKDALLPVARQVIATEHSLLCRCPEIPGAPEVFFEYLPPPPALLLAGGGDDAVPLARFAADLGWSVSVLDPRSAMATAERFAGAEQVLAVRPEAWPKTLPADRRTAAVVMHHHYWHDLAALERLLPLPLFYLGLLGPGRRAERLLKAAFAQNGPAPTSLPQLHAPVGIDLGAETPEEIALAILAEIQCRLSGRRPGFLRDRPGPIHARPLTELDAPAPARRTVARIAQN